MGEITFLVKEMQTGGYVAKTADDSIFTEARSIFELNKMIREAVATHFDKDNLPKIKLEFSNN